MSISTRGAEWIRPKAFFTGREIGASTARAATLRMVRLALLIFVSSLDTVPSHQSRRRPVRRHRLHQPAPGRFGRECDPLRLSRFDYQRIQPEWLPPVVEPVQQPEMRTMAGENFRDLLARDQRPPAVVAPNSVTQRHATPPAS